MIALVRATFAGMDEAERIAGDMVARRLAACANLTPCRSVYRWDGAVARDDEVVGLFKTRPATVPALVAAIGAAHGHALPAITWWEAAATAGISGWVDDAAGG